jgi:FecR protein/Putative zinc-finger
MTDCGNYEELISLSVTSELSYHERDQLDEHLSHCPDCRALLRKEKKLWDLIEEHRRSRQISPELAARLLKNSGTPSSIPVIKKHKLKLLPILAGAISAAALILIVALLGNRQPEKKEALPVATVQSGRLEIHDGEQWITTEIVYSGQLCRVPSAPGSRACLLLKDGSIIKLERGMSFLLHRGISKEVNGKRTIELLSGALTAEVAKDKSKEFVIETPGGKVTATGTRFWVRAGPPEGKENVMGKRSIIAGTLATALAVAVFEGSVEVLAAEADGRDPVKIVAGQETEPQTNGKTGKVKIAARTVASAIPADAMIFFSAAGRPRWESVVKKSCLGAIYREEQVKVFLKPVVTQIEARIADLRKRLEHNIMNVIKFENVEKALQGEVGVAMLGTSAKKNGKEEPILLFVAEVGQHADVFETGMAEFVANVQQLLRAEAGKQATLTARTYRGTDLRIFKIKEDNAKVNTIAYAQLKGYFLLAFDPLVLEKGVDCLENKTPSLASVAKIKRNSKTLLRISGDIKALIAKDRANKAKKQNWTEFDQLGFSAAQRLEYRLSFLEPGFKETLTVPLKPPHKGLLKILEHCRPANLALAAGDAPKDALGLLSVNLPTDKFFSSLKGLLKDMGKDKEFADMEKGLNDLKSQGIDLKKLLTSSVTGEISAYACPAVAGLIPDAVLILKLKDSKQVLGNIQAIADVLIRNHAVKIATKVGPDGKVSLEAGIVRQVISKLDLKTAKYRGGTLLYLPPDASKPGKPMPAALIIKDRLILASNTTAAKRAANRIDGDNSLAKSGAFRTATANLPGDASIIQYLDTASVLRIVYPLTIHNLSPKSALGKRFGLVSDPPPVDVVARHIAPEFLLLRTSAKSISIESRSNIPRAAMIGAFILQQQKKRNNRIRSKPRPGQEF